MWLAKTTASRFWRPGEILNIKREFQICCKNLANVILKRIIAAVEAEEEEAVAERIEWTKLWTEQRCPIHVMNRTTISGRRRHF